MAEIILKRLNKGQMRKLIYIFSVHLVFLNAIGQVNTKIERQIEIIHSKTKVFQDSISKLIT